MDQSLILQARIVQLPPDILFKIFRLAGCISTKNHNIRLVCKQFYQVYSIDSIATLHHVESRSMLRK